MLIAANPALSATRSLANRVSLCSERRSLRRSVLLSEFAAYLHVSLGSRPPPFRALLNYAHAYATTFAERGRPGRKHHVRVDVGYRVRLEAWHVIFISGFFDSPFLADSGGEE